MKRLTKKQVLQMHKALITQTGGSYELREEALLDAALAAPFQAFAGEELFPSISAKAARLGYGLIQNHAFVDGNKRIGVHAMLVFLALNGIVLEYTQKELYTVVLDVAGGRCSLEGLLNWILQHQV